MKVLFHYKKRTLKMHLVMGFLWSILGVFCLIFVKEKNWFSYLYLPIGLFFFYLYFYDKNKGYITYNNSIIKKQAFPKKQFNLKHLKRIKRANNGITLIATNNQKFLIDDTIIEAHDVEKLYKTLETYESKIII